MDSDRFRPLREEEREQVDDTGGSAKDDLWEPIVPIPDTIPDPNLHHWILGRPAATWLYRDENGNRVCFIGRYNKAGGCKEFRPRTWCRNCETGIEEWRWKNVLPLRPLYGAELLRHRSEARAVVTEGEKACEAARSIFTAEVVLSPMNGAKSPHKADWKTLKGRDVIVWPDHDETGQSFAVAVAGLLKGVAASICVVDIEKLIAIDGGLRGVTHNPDGWDAADAVLEWDDPVALRAKVMELVKPYEAEWLYTDYTTVPEGPEAQEKFRSALRERIEALHGMDENRARAIVVDAVKARLSGLAIESLIGPLAKKLGVTLPSARKFWREIEGEISSADAAHEEQKRDALSRQERNAAAREEARKFEEERAETRKRLELSCREIAHDSKLLARLTDTARKAGVIGEDGSIRSTYIAASSRFNRRKGICLLRRGAPAGGKNFVTDTVLRLIPEEDVVRVSSGSPLSLVYYGDGDEDALKHKIVYVAEAAILAERNGVESVLTIMLRLLISEGRIDHQVVVPRPNAPAATVRIRRNGPVVVLMTSARNNIEEELLTRLMNSDADESQEQTENVIKAALSNDDGEGAKQKLSTEINKLIDYQRWIALDAPYEVSIPYRLAVLRALHTQRRAASGRGEKPKFKLRIRRDIQGFLTAINTSAILHKAQRALDENGRIIATLDDYQHAHEAFDPGLASLYKTTSPVTTIAVVRAIEEMGASITASVKVTVTSLMEKLGISGRGTANDRLRDAEERGYIKLVEKQGGYGRTTPREYTIGKYAVEIEREALSSVGSGVFPSREAVEAAQRNYSDEPQPPRYTGTDGTRRHGEPCYTDCITVPEWVGPLEEKNLEPRTVPDNGSSTSKINSDNRNVSGKPPRWFAEI